MGLTFGGMVRSGELVETESRGADRAFVTDRAVKTERRMLAAARAERGKGQAQAEPVAVEVMPGLVPGIHAAVRGKRWKGMPGTSPGMTRRGMTRRGVTGRGMTERVGAAGAPTAPVASLSVAPECAPSIMPGRPLHHAGTPPFVMPGLVPGIHAAVRGSG